MEIVGNVGKKKRMSRVRIPLILVLWVVLTVTLSLTLFRTNILEFWSLWFNSGMVAAVITILVSLLLGSRGNREKPE